MWVEGSRARELDIRRRGENCVGAENMRCRAEDERWERKVEADEG